MRYYTTRAWSTNGSCALRREKQLKIARLLSLRGPGLVLLATFSIALLVAMGQLQALLAPQTLDFLVIHPPALNPQ